MDNDFGDVSSVLPTDEKKPEPEMLFWQEQQKRMEAMVKDPKWVPILVSIESRLNYFKSMGWVDGAKSNEEIGENAKVGALVIQELEGILDEVRQVAGFVRPNDGDGGPAKSSGRAKKPVQKGS